MKKNLIFIGMPAVGKSTVGIVVAKRLGMRFIDTDLLIQEQEGKLLREIIAESGVDEFLEIENRVNASVKDQNAVISRGEAWSTVKKPWNILKRLERSYI